MRSGIKILVVLLLVMGRWAAAQTSTFVVDSKQSRVAFTLGGVMHTVEGTFQVSDGEVKFDRNAAEMSGLIRVTAGSGKSGNETRDRRMSKEILEAAKFDVVSFKPERMLGTIAESGDSTVEVSGVFTVHGASHPLKVPVTLHTESGQCVAKTHFVVPYVDWGMKDPSTFVFRVAKEVSIDLTLVGQITPAK